MKFSTRLKNLLDEHSLTQKRLSFELNIAPSTLNGYLRRNREPDFETLGKLAKYFQVSTDYLLGLSNLKNPSLPGSFYPADEEELLQIYRSLVPEYQEVFTELAKLLQKFSEKNSSKDN